MAGTRWRSVGVACLAVVAWLGCGDDTPEVTDFSDVSAPVAPDTQARGAGSATELILYDHGLQMPRARMQLPPGWRAQQDIATDPNTGGVARFHLDVIGPQGELWRSSAPGSYTNFTGTAFEPLWRQTVMTSLQGALESVSLGALRPSPALAQLPSVQKAMREQNAQALETDLTAMRGPTRYAGRVFVIHSMLPENPQAGVLAASVVVSPPPLLEQAVATSLRISASQQMNPAFEAAAQRLQQQAMANSWAQHQQRMANNQARFNAHQQRMANNQAQFDNYMAGVRAQSNANDAQHQAWMNQNLRQDYSAHDQFVDHIRDTDTFHDPDTGGQVQLDAHYDRTFTDGLGNFYQSSDPSFDPSSLDGDWAEVQPLQPGN
ncbi:MAG: hypothetical protein AAF430_15420 [Myxococcota bacterium]